MRIVQEPYGNATKVASSGLVIDGARPPQSGSSPSLWLKKDFSIARPRRNYSGNAFRCQLDRKGQIATDCPLAIRICVGLNRTALSISYKNLIRQRFAANGRVPGIGGQIALQKRFTLDFTKRVCSVNFIEICTD